MNKTESNSSQNIVLIFTQSVLPALGEEAEVSANQDKQISELGSRQKAGRLQNDLAICTSQAAAEQKHREKHTQRFERQEVHQEASRPTNYR